MTSDQNRMSATVFQPVLRLQEGPLVALCRASSAARFPSTDPASIIAYFTAVRQTVWAVNYYSQTYYYKISYGVRHRSRTMDNGTRHLGQPDGGARWVCNGFPAQTVRVAVSPDEGLWRHVFCSIDDQYFLFSSPRLRHNVSDQQTHARLVTLPECTDHHVCHA